jgi:hypothetical protein
VKFGKTAARPGAVSLKFADIVDVSKLPPTPPVFGHQSLMMNDNWFMLGNDSVGDCVFAGAAHEHMLWTMEGGVPRARFTTADALRDYSAVTGYVVGNESTDNGTDMQTAASYRRSTGVIDADGVRHKITAYMALEEGRVDQLAAAAYLFGAAGFGFQVPASAENQFSTGQPWDVVAGDSLVGGHYVPVVGRVANGNLVVVTWGRTQEMTPAFAQKYNDESLAYFDIETLAQNTRLSPEGFDIVALGQFLKEINT